MQYLMRHPGVIDELADERLLHERFDRAEFTHDLEQRHAAWVRSGQADEESLLDTLAARPARRGLPHPGARCRGPAERGGGGR